MYFLLQRLFCCCYIAVVVVIVLFFYLFSLILASIHSLKEKKLFSSFILVIETAFELSLRRGY